MNVATLSQWQFAITSIYHFFFVPLTLGLSLLIAIMESIYVRTGNEIYRQMTKFWGNLFLINFAMGVVTGIVQEFQFGMNWANYSRFVGDIFGAPLAIEALLAFFLESTFLGIWIFGWDKLGKKTHLAAIWVVAIASTLSALWILIANSFMQQPPAASYAIENGRAVMKDFIALIMNANLFVQFPHTVLSGMVTGGFFVLGISAYHLFRKHNVDLFVRSFKIAAIFGLIAIFLEIGAGHAQAQHMIRTQPMKMAAAEALWETEDPASFSLFTIVNQEKMNDPDERDIVSIRIPGFTSFLAYNRFSGPVKGIINLQEEYETKYGPDNYVPSIIINYWTFRIMVGLGFLMLLLAMIAVYFSVRKRVDKLNLFLKFLPFAIAFPYLANTAGWLLTEMGRQPWIVFGLMKTTDAVSPTLTPAMVWTSLIAFTLIYGALMIVDVYLLVRYAQAGSVEEGEFMPSEAGI